ncbi:predicted protein [Nematostella vectensis]|uniref:Uncharacterized protein n=1 Tax=Nematostella vectensis TaxID=45351 RepID=A7RSN1_NEMVE|nr:predicted protein [Nematostella vectensis]|eukprot:XP_001637506.1 predicted protein [Nematostella vectensis]
MLAIVIGLSVLLFLLILIFCCVVCQLRRRNKAEEAQLYAARARSFTSPQSYGNPVDKTDNAPFDSSIIDMIEANASCPEYLHTRSSSNPGYHGSPVRLTNSEPTESSTDMIEEYGNSQHIEERLRNARHVPLPGLNGNPVDGSNARETRSNERLQAPPTLYLDANGNGAVGRYGNDSRSHPGSYGNPVYNNNRATIIRNGDPRSARETDYNDVRLVTMEYREFLRLPTMNGNPVDRSAPQNTENYRNYRYVATGYPSGNYPPKRYPTKGYPSTIPELFEGPLEEDDLSVNSSSSEMTINTSTRDIAVDFQTKRQKRKLRAATAASYGASTTQFSIGTVNSMPTTNLHVAEGSNPIWVDPYHNWGLNTDDEDKAYMETFGDAKKSRTPLYDNAVMDRAHGNPLFESQEISYDYVDLDNDSHDYETMNGKQRRPSNNRPASPEVYESSTATSPKSLYLQDSRFQVTSI